MEDECVIGKLRNREALCVYHHLKRINALTYNTFGWFRWEKSGKPRKSRERKRRKSLKRQQPERKEKYRERQCRANRKQDHKLSKPSARHDETPTQHHIIAYSVCADRG
jgi:hypothetical protein